MKMRMTGPQLKRHLKQALENSPAKTQKAFGKPRFSGAALISEDGKQALVYDPETRETKVVKYKEPTKKVRK